MEPAGSRNSTGSSLDFVKWSTKTAIGFPEIILALFWSKNVWKKASLSVFSTTLLSYLMRIGNFLVVAGYSPASCNWKICPSIDQASSCQKSDFPQDVRCSSAFSASRKPACINNNSKCSFSSENYGKACLSSSPKCSSQRDSRSIPLKRGAKVQDGVIAGTKWEAVAYDLNHFVHRLSHLDLLCFSERSSTFWGNVTVRNIFLKLPKLTLHMQLL